MEARELSVCTEDLWFVAAEGRADLVADTRAGMFIAIVVAQVAELTSMASVRLIFVVICGCRLCCCNDRARFLLTYCHK